MLITKHRISLINVILIKYLLVFDELCKLEIKLMMWIIFYIYYLKLIHFFSSL